MTHQGVRFAQFSRRKILITGGSSGIGKAAARILTRSGADVGIAARNRVNLEIAQSELESETLHRDQKIRAFPLDVGSGDQIQETVPAAIQSLGGLDLLVNNAGASRPGYVAELSGAVWEELMRVNFLGAVGVTRACLPHFMQQQSGHVVNMASTLGFMGIFGYGPYAASKFALVGFSECLRQDLLPFNVDVSVVYPPDTDTPLWHEENRFKPPETRILAGKIRVMQPERVAEIMLRGILKKQMTIIPGRTNRLIHRLFRLSPGLIRHMMESDLKKYYRHHPLRTSGTETSPDRKS